MATDYEALARQFGGTVAGPAPETKPPTTTAAAPIDYAAMAAKFGGQVAAQPKTTAAGLAGAATRGLALPVTGAALGALAGAPIGGVGAIPGALAGAGTAAIIGIVGDPIVDTVNNLFGTKYQRPTEAMEDLLTRIGVAEPKTEAERIVQATAAGAAGAGGTVAAGRAIQTAAGQAAPVAREVGRLIASQPVLQVAGGAGAGAAGQAAKEQGMGAGAQIAASVAGAIAPVGIAASVPAISRAVSRRAAPAAAKQRIEPTIEPMPTQPVAAAPAAAQAIPEQPAAQAAAQAIPEQPAVQTAAEAFEEVGSLVRKASGKGPGSDAAKARLADLAQVNTEARAAAERLGMDLPFDVFSDNPQVRAAVGLTRSVAGGEPYAAWQNTLKNAVAKADDIVQQFDAVFITGTPSTASVSESILNNLKNTRNKIIAEKDALYKEVDSAIPKPTKVTAQNLKQTISSIKEELGMSAYKNAAIKDLEKMADNGMTYGGLSFEKTRLGDAKRAGTQNIYSSNLNLGIIKRLEAAIAQDQLDNVAEIAGEEIRNKLRAANLLVAKEKALETRIVGAFGKEADGSVANLMQSAIKSASKGDAAQFNKLMKVVPPELRKETVATALASVASSSRAAQEGAFGFAEFAKTYRGLRANPPVYKQMISAIGDDADKVLRDLYEISRRITDARAQVLTTGKANQALVESMKAEGLIGKVMQSDAAQRFAGAAASTLGPVGGAVTPDIIRFMSTGKDVMQAAGKLFASDDFQKLAVEAATKPQVSNATLKRTAMSDAFRKYADAAKLPQGIDARVQWLQAAIQAGPQIQQETE
jgi:hypothetical protein